MYLISRQKLKLYSTCRIDRDKTILSSEKNYSSNVQCLSHTTILAIWIVFSIQLYPIVQVKKIIIDSVEINFSVVFLNIQKFQPKNAFDA